MDKIPIQKTNSSYVVENVGLVLIPNVGRRPTFFAGRKIIVAVKAAHCRQPQSFGDIVLTDRGIMAEIAQWPLGDFNFYANFLH